MATREGWFPGEPCWIDLYTSDVPKARSFYQAVFGWRPGEQAEEFGGYFQFFLDDAPVAGGMATIPGGGAPDSWSLYLACSDAAETLALGAKHGATVAVETMQVAELGTMGVMIDPGGAAIGIWAPIDFIGFARVEEPGAPRWYELHTGAYEASLEFYATVFGWELSAMDTSGGRRYSTAGRQGKTFAGILEDPHSAPRWEIRFGTRDTDATIAAALDHGGSQPREAQDTPFGRVGYISDTTGVSFIVQSFSWGPWAD